MSFPGKENLKHFENLNMTQSRIFPDSLDIGIEVTPGADTWASSVKKDARENLLALMSMYAYELFRPETARFPYDTDFEKCSKTRIFIPFEFDEGAYVGVTLTVDFQTITVRGKSREYLSIVIIRDRKRHSDIVGKLFKV